MVIVGRLVLKDPNGSGRVEVTVSHNTHPGAEYEAKTAFRMMCEEVCSEMEDVTIEYPGTWAG